MSANASCPHCGCGTLVRGCIGLRCPLCGEQVFLKDTSPEQDWAEHKLGLLYRRGGWSLMDVFEPPAWFMEDVI